MIHAERARLKAELERVTAALATLPQGTNQMQGDEVAFAREQLEDRETQTRDKIDQLPAITGDPPMFQPHRDTGTGAFNLHLPAGPLNAHLSNNGGSAALVQRARLTTPLGEFDGQMWEQHGRVSDTLPSASTRVAVDGHLTLQFGDGQLASLPQNGGELTLSVTYTRADDRQLFEYRLQLLRAGGGVTDRPQWRAGRESTLRLSSD